jgi:hypothetical protein
MINVDTNKQVGDKDHLKVFASQDAAETWLVWFALNDDRPPTKSKPVPGALTWSTDF